MLGVHNLSSSVMTNSVRFGATSAGQLKLDTVEAAISYLKSPHPQTKVVDYFTKHFWGHQASIIGENKDKTLQMQGHGPHSNNSIRMMSDRLKKGDYLIIPATDSDANNQRLAVLVQIQQIEYETDPNDMWVASKAKIIASIPREKAIELMGIKV